MGEDRVGVDGEGEGAGVWSGEKWMGGEDVYFGGTK